MLKSKRNIEIRKIAVLVESNLDPCHKMPEDLSNVVNSE